ncbi:FK506-binding protein-like [Aphelocoma coerulescens]|uniref:FK506-binding protein-like n=1 Tax=Aphelocoma coerulescens TaxID=39617 RepID=UPI003604A66B
MEGAASANGEEAPGTTNEGTDTAGVPANQQRDEEQGAANGSAELEGSANQGKGTGSPANQEAELQEVTNENEGPEPANEDRGQKGPTNQDAGHKVPADAAVATPAANQDSAPPAPANQDSAPRAAANEGAAPAVPTNQDSAPRAAANQDSAPPAPANQDSAPRAAANEDSTLQAPPSQAPPPQDPTNELLAPLPAAANGARDPWDWSQEEAWLRAPEGEEPEAWGAEPEGWGAEPGEDEEEEDEDEESEADEGPERWRPSPDGAWAKLIVRPGRGLARPGPGSRCRVLLSVAPGGCPAWGAVSPASGAGRWASVRLGSAEGRWACVLDAALETMAGGERARLRPAGAARAALSVRLGRFTPAPPLWAAPAAARWRSVTAGQARAAALLARGLVAAAGRAYAGALRAAVAAGGPPPLSAEVSGVKAELHAGLALVQLRLGLPAAAAANAGKALALRPAHLEARYRRAVAQAAMMDLEAATADLVAVLRAQPGHAGARRELRRVRGAARDRDARLARRLGRLFA